jgi:hypothetical protein
MAQDNDVYYFTVSEGRESRTGLVDGSGSWCPLSLQSRCQTGLQSSKGLTGAGGSVSQKAHTPGRASVSLGFSPSRFLHSAAQVRLSSFLPDE